VLSCCAILQGQKQQQADHDDDLTKSNSVVFNTFIFMQVSLAYMHQTSDVPEEAPSLQSSLGPWPPMPGFTLPSASALHVE